MRQLERQTRRTPEPSLNRTVPTGNPELDHGKEKTPPVKQAKPASRPKRNVVPKQRRGIRP